LSRLLSAIAAEAGARLVEIKTTGSGHKKVVLDRNGFSIGLVTSSTPSDYRSTKNFEAFARRQLRKARKWQANKDTI
jgi:hypothetical protein